MLIREIKGNEQVRYDAVVNHPLQSWAWGEARKTTGVKVVRLGMFQGKNILNAWTMTIHPIPGLRDKNILYFPKGPMPDEQFTSAISLEAQRLEAVFVKIEPNVQILNGELGIGNNSTEQLSVAQQKLIDLGYRKGRSLFTPYNFIIDLTQTEDELLRNMKPKTRYNVRLAEKKGVKVIEGNSNEAFEAYLELLAETTNRQKFYAHDANYHKKVWKYMHRAGIARLLTAVYGGKILSAWILFKWKDKLYYPYGASSREHREVMANNLMMWEAMKFGKKNGCKIFDLWGTAGLNPKPDDAWYGFHRFKEGYGPKVVKYVGTYDYVIDPIWYSVVTKLEMVRRWLLKIKAMMR